MYRGYGRFSGYGQAPGTPVSTTTTSTTGTLGGGATITGLPGPETWGSDPVYLAMVQMGGSIIQNPLGNEEQFAQIAVRAIVSLGYVQPSLPDATVNTGSGAQNACWTAAYVYAYYAIQSLLATGSTLTGSKVTGGTLGGPANVYPIFGGGGATITVSQLTHQMYGMLRADTYAMAYYAGYLTNKTRGRSPTGGMPRPGKLVAVGTGTRATYVGRPGAAAPVPGARPPAAAAAAPAASSNTGLILGGLVVAGAAAYLLL